MKCECWYALVTDARTWLRLLCWPGFVQMNFYSCFVLVSDSCLVQRIFYSCFYSCLRFLFCPEEYFYSCFILVSDSCFVQRNFYFMIWRGAKSQSLTDWLTPLLPLWNQTKRHSDRSSQETHLDSSICCCWCSSFRKKSRRQVASTRSVHCLEFFRLSWACMNIENWGRTSGDVFLAGWETPRPGRHVMQQGRGRG